MELSKIIEILKYCVMAIPAIVVLAACIAVIRRPHQGKPNVTRMVKNVLRVKTIVMILLIAVVYLMLFIGVRYVQSLVEGEIVIGFNYAEASQGLNPNNTRFNTYDIIDDEVLNQAIAEEGLGELTAAQLRETLSVEPLEAGEIVSGEHYYVAAEYVLRYEASVETLGLGANTVLKAVSDAYYEQFLERYSRKTSVLEVDYSQLDEVDYLDQVDILEKLAGDVAEYMYMCTLESSTYVGKNGESFSSLSAKVKNLAEVELEKLTSYILRNGLSVDNKVQVSKLEYENLIKNINYDKNMASYEVGLETIRMYERDMATAVLVPTIDETGEFYMSRTKLGVDNFADQSYQYSQRATLVGSDIADNSYAINQLKNSTATEGEYTMLEDMMGSFKRDLSAFANEGKRMVRDFDEKTKGNFLNFNLEEYDITDKDNIIKYIFLMGLMVVAGSIFAAVVPNGKKLRKERIVK